MAKQKIEIEGEFRQDKDGDVWFGTSWVLYKDGESRTDSPPELVAAARAWLEEQKNTVEVTVTFRRDGDGDVLANGFRTISNHGKSTLLADTFPELAEAARKWARRNPG